MKSNKTLLSARNIMHTDNTKLTVCAQHAGQKDSPPSLSLVPPLPPHHLLLLLPHHLAEFRRSLLRHCWQSGQLQPHHSSFYLLHRERGEERERENLRAMARQIKDKLGQKARMEHVVVLKVHEHFYS